MIELILIKLNVERFMFRYFITEMIHMKIVV